MLGWHNTDISKQFTCGTKILCAHNQQLNSHSSLTETMRGQATNITRRALHFPNNID
jgi:hypothetical protein